MDSAQGLLCAIENDHLPRSASDSTELRQVAGNGRRQIWQPARIGKAQSFEAQFSRCPRLQSTPNPPREFIGVCDACIERAWNIGFAAGRVRSRDESSPRRAARRTGRQHLSRSLQPSQFRSNKCAASNRALKKSLVRKLTEDFLH
jgi:hypothetical protein